MSDGMVIKIVNDALYVLIMLLLPILGTGMFVGLFIGILQTTTSIQEQTLTFVPKLAAIIGALLVFGPWMLKVFSGFTIRLLKSLSEVVQ